MNTALNLQGVNEEQSGSQLLRPHQIAEREDERESIKGMLNQPDYIQAQMENRDVMVRRLRQVERSLAEGSPQPYSSSEDLDAAVAEEKRLREHFEATMLSRDEMMRNPDGAADKLIRWEKANKKDVLRWKALRLRLRASDVDFGFDRDVANLEVYRPGSRDSDLNTNKNAQIAPKTQFFFGSDPSNSVMFGDDDLAKIAELNPELFSRLAFASNFERRQIRNVLDGHDPMHGLEMPGGGDAPSQGESGDTTSRKSGKAAKG